MQDAIAKNTARAQAVVERIILYSRFILVIFYLGLGVALAAFAMNFVVKLYVTLPKTIDMTETDLILTMLVLIDKALIAGLIVMVMLSSYENFVGRFGDEVKQDSPTWLGSLDPGSLKIKVAASLVAISSISLLQVFLDMKGFTESEILWKSVLHGVFIASALALGFLDRLTAWHPGGEKS